MENCFWAQEYDSWNHRQSEDSSLLVPWLSPGEQYHCYNPVDDVPPWAQSFEGVAEDRSASASRSHSEAEKRRRDRINAQLATLRKLIPMSEKMDKAALLGHVVDHVKEQSQKAKEVSKFSTIPTETDEVIIEYLNAEEARSQDNHSIHMKASICCDDRPELLAELNTAIKGLRLTIFQAEITSLGGRMKSNFVLCANKEQNVCTTSLKQSLKFALSRVVISSGTSSYSVRSKRQRFFYPNPH